MGNWQRSYPQIACGLKRGFSFFHHGERLLVAASPRDDIADTHWYREEVDHFLVMEAQSLGVEYLDCVRIEDLVFTEKEAIVGGQSGSKSFWLTARLLIDATGPRGFLHRSLQLPESALPGIPLTESLYSHFTEVERTDCSGEASPYPVDDAAVHHVFDGGWVWVLRFNNGVTSAGVAATRRRGCRVGAQRRRTRVAAAFAPFARACDHSSSTHARANRFGTCRRSVFVAVRSQESDGQCCLPPPGLLTLCSRRGLRSPSGHRTTCADPPKGFVR